MEDFPVKYKSFINRTTAPVAVVNERLQIVGMNAALKKTFHLDNRIKDPCLMDYPVFREGEFISLVLNGFKRDFIETTPLKFALNEQVLNFNVAVSRLNEEVSLVEIIFEPHNTEKMLIHTQSSLKNSFIHPILMFKLVKSENDFQIETATGSLFSLLGINEENVEQKRVQEILSKEHAAEFIPICERVWENQVEETCEGVVYGFEFIASFIPIVENGTTTKLFSVVTDISSIKKTQRELDRNQQKYQSLMYDHADNIFLIDRNFIIKEINHAAEKRMKMPSDSMIGKDYRNFVQKERFEITKGYFQRALAGETLTYDTVIVNNDLTESHIHCTLIPIFIDGNIEGVYGVGRDITEFVEIDKKLKQMITILEAYFNHTNDGASLLSEDGAFITINDQFKLMLGWKKDELIRGRISDLFHEEQPDEDKEKIEEAFKGKDIDHLETCLKTKNGKALPVSININSIHSENGEVIGIALFIQDLTSIKVTENLLKKSEQLSLIGQLAAGVAHEIRNPLTTIKGFLQLLAEDNKAANYIELLQKELDRIEFITGEFLSLARPQATKFKRTSLNKIIHDAIEFIKMEAFNSHIDIDFQIEELDCDCELNQIKQVFLNIFMNAIEAMPNGGQLEVTLKKEGENAAIVIKDTGAGIDKERLKNLGEPFYSTKEKGTGLGLLVCRKIVQSHKGTMDIQSEVNKGTKVLITIPILHST
ncbi:PAS domain-containing sensor histidine kinase [Jeotgalibacillus proteolyticus]|uniref:histidine kinase n=1 Tax=Jeotgalibacillus proteolyticus TaxID=2082395 RepID=A0A2S5G7A7_9BACL|nr:PAS domain-containing sensor histidine kinase [Jeotgalibacillus proteolyticus]PPA68860.1 hypothetical protein C4B60_18250 [Jeotgalibacillus proteolyticus]